MGNLSGTIYLMNQKNPSYPLYIRDSGCAVCSAGMAASYYAKKLYSLADLLAAGLYQAGSAICQWTWNCNANATVSVGCTFTENSFSYSTVRSEIDNNRPVIIIITDTASHMHVVMAYGYSGFGNSTSTVLVADPADGTTKTLASAISYSFAQYQTADSATPSRLKITAKKIATTPGTIYKMMNIGASKYLNVYGDNLTSLYNGINVTLWSDSNTNEQKWSISNLGSAVHICSAIDTQYGLNIYRSGSPYNCNIYKISGNEQDATFDITTADASGYRKVRWISSDGTQTLYLTAGASADGSNVYWDVSSSSNYQKWRFIPVS